MGNANMGALTASWRMPCFIHLSYVLWCYDV